MQRAQPVPVQVTFIMIRDGTLGMLTRIGSENDVGADKILLRRPSGAIRIKFAQENMDVKAGIDGIFLRTR